MKDIYIGKNPNGGSIYLTPEQRVLSHMHVIGGTRTGKSKFLEWMIRQDITAGHGVCVIDYHGKLYHDLLRWCSHSNVGIFNDDRKLYLINPSQPRFVSGFNPFARGRGEVSTQVSYLIDALMRAWGARDTDETPLLELVCAVVFRFMIEGQETLPNASKLFEFSRREVFWDYARRVITDGSARSEAERFLRVKQEDKWNLEMGSSRRRFGRLLRSTGIKRFMGLETGNLDIESLMTEGNVILVNLGQSDNLPPDMAKIFASLFVLQFFQTAMRRSERASYRGEDPPMFLLYLDEFQNYINEDIADALDQALKGGLHMILAHQHLGHFVDNERIADSVFTNARIRAVFGGLKPQSAAELADLMFLDDLTERQVVKAFHTIIHLYDKQYDTTHSSTRGRSTTHAHGTTSGAGSGSSVGAGSSSGQNVGQSIMRRIGVDGTPLEGWSDTENSSTSSSDSEFQSETESEFNAESSSDAETVSESEGETRFPVWVPIPQKNVTHEEIMSPEEKRNKIVLMLHSQMQRHCFIKLDNEKTQPMWVPLVSQPAVSVETLGDYEDMVYAEQGALPATEVDRLLKESEQSFLQRVQKQSEPPPAEGSHRNVYDIDDDTDVGYVQID